MPRCITAPSEQYKLALAVSLGGMLELYDFLIYAMMASYIAENFFPSADSVSSLIGTFAAFAVSYLTRPLGGLVFGHFGDRLGRKKTFTLTIFMIAVTTALIGCLPTYDSIGVAAPIILVLLRLCQGFSLGGELPGAITYLSECAPQRKGLMVGILYLALMAGISLGTLVQGLLTLILGSEVMQEWGWRVPFWIGGLLGIVSYQIRKRFNESGLFLTLDLTRQRASIPILTLLKEHRRGLFCGILMMALCGATVTVYGVYMPGYLSSLLGFPRSEVAWHTAVAFLALSPLSLLAGLLTDVVNRKCLMIVLVVLVIGLSFPAFHYFSSDEPQLRKILMVCALYTAIGSGVMPPMIINFFPTEVRYTGIATVYNFGFAVFGGLAPLASTILVKYVGTTSGPALYLVSVACVSVAALLLRWPDYQDSGESEVGSKKTF